MELTAVGQLICSVGFPCVMCMMLYKSMEKQTEAHRAEMDKITEALNNNTVAITELTARLDAGRD